MARLGENAQPQASHPGIDIPTVEDIIGIKLKSQLPAVGKRLIEEAPVHALGGGEEIDVSVKMRLMPCGLYAAELALPENFVRLCSVKMACWRRGVSDIVMPDDPGWSRQWSTEAGIAGSPHMPRIYMVMNGGGVKLRALGSETESDSLEGLYGWLVPEVGDDGTFHFPATLYPALLDTLTP